MRLLADRNPIIAILKEWVMIEQDDIAHAWSKVVHHSGTTKPGTDRVIVAVHFLDDLIHSPQCGQGIAGAVIQHIVAPEVGRVLELRDLLPEGPRPKEDTRGVMAGRLCATKTTFATEQRSRCIAPIAYELFPDLDYTGFGQRAMPGSEWNRVLGSGHCTAQKGSSIDVTDEGIHDLDAVFQTELALRRTRIEKLTAAVDDKVHIRFFQHGQIL